MSVRRTPVGGLARSGEPVVQLDQRPLVVGIQPLVGKQRRPGRQRLILKPCGHVIENYADANVVADARSQGLLGRVTPTPNS